MKFRSIINGVYRQTAPDAEATAVPGTPAPGPEAEAPASEPEAVVTPPVDEGQDTIPDEDANLWDALSNDLDDVDEQIEDLREEEALAEPEPPAEEPPPEAPAEPEATPEAEPPAEPVAADTAVPEEPEVQPTEPEPEPIPQPTEEEQQVAYAARKTEIETTLTGRFALDEADALQLVTDPGKAFPKLQARMFTDMWLAVESMIDQRLPGVIENTTRNMKVRDEKVDDFFTAWPKLDRKKHGTQVAQVAAVYAQVNKGATEDEVIKHVGMQVMMMNGIIPDNVVDTPPVETPAETPTPPHRPAAVHGAKAPVQSSDNVYEQMSYELDDDED